MSDYKLVVDSTCDLPYEYYEKHNVAVASLSMLLGDTKYDESNPIDPHEFYEMVRKGAMPTSSQINPTEAKAFMEKVLKESKKLLVVSFSSGLSGSFQSMRLAAMEIMDENEDVEIKVVDSLCASLGEGLLVHKIIEKIESGASFEEAYDYAEKIKLNVVHMFTVEDLNHLHRGGRISKATAVLGTMVNIKPIMHMDNEGHLTSVGKSRGRKKSLTSLVDAMEEKMGSFKDKNDWVFISHGDCKEDAEFVADEIKNRFGINNFIINFVGPVIGTHSGPGTVALFFMGDER